jgi:hypothetical protein
MASNSNSATNPLMPKVAPPLPNLPGTAVRPGNIGSGGEGKKERLLADLRRQVFISVSLSSSQSSPPLSLRQTSHNQRDVGEIPRIPRSKYQPVY